MDSIKRQVLASLSCICDPEIPLDIVSLGLVKDIKIKGNALSILMTLTTPNCPLENVIKQMVIKKLSTDFPDYKVDVEFDFSVPWSSNHISEEGKKKLKELGWKI